MDRGKHMVSLVLNKQLQEKLNRNKRGSCNNMTKSKLNNNDPDYVPPNSESSSCSDNEINSQLDFKPPFSERSIIQLLLSHVLPG